MCRTVLCRVESVHISELNAEVRERKAHGLGDGRKGHAGLLFHKALGFLQADTVDVSRESTSIRIRIKDCVQMLTPKTEAPHDILPVKVRIGIKTFLTDGLIYKTEQVFI